MAVRAAHLSTVWLKKMDRNTSQPTLQYLRRILTPGQKLANILYIDQPVGTGYSGGGDRATLNAQVTQDFEIWLKAFYDVFPRLRSKNTYINGESYSGIFVSIY